MVGWASNVEWARVRAGGSAADGERQLAEGPIGRLWRGLLDARRCAADSGGDGGYLDVDP